MARNCHQRASINILIVRKDVVSSIDSMSDTALIGFKAGCSINDLD